LIFFHNKRHPAETGKFNMAQFLTHLAVDKNVAVSVIKPEGMVLTS